MDEDYYEGKDCKCLARSSAECGCDADWTDPEIHKLKAEVKELQAELKANQEYTQELEDTKLPNTIKTRVTNDN